MTAASAAQIGAIHTIAKRIGLDEGSRRDLIAAVAGGKRSAGQLTSGEAIRVIDRLKGLQQGGSASGAAMAQGALDLPDDPVIAKLRALWLSGWHLAVVHDRTDRAMAQFVVRETGLGDIRWLRKPEHKRKAVEHLKAWLARAAGVEWPATAEVRASKLAVLRAQRRLIAAAGCRVLPASGSEDGNGQRPAPGVRPGEIRADITEAEIDAEIRSGGATLRRLLKGRKNGG